MKQCQYCLRYQGGINICQVDDNGKTVFKRKCYGTHNIVESSTPACPDFEVSSRFWCDKDQNWILMDGCIARQKKGHARCATCKQGKTVHSIVFPQFRRK